MEFSEDKTLGITKIAIAQPKIGAKEEYLKKQKAGI